MTEDRYTIRHTTNGRHIDIVHCGDGPGSGAIIRVPVRSGRLHLAQDTAATVCKLLNAYARNAHDVPEVS